MEEKQLIKKKIAEIKKEFAPKKIVLGKEYWDEFNKSKEGVNAMNWYNSIKMTNSYAEAKQHNLI